MGNTKYIWFEGYAKRESKDAFDPVELREQSSGPYAAVEIDEKGYLSSNKPDNGETDIYVIGIIHSFSMSGLRVREYLKKHLTLGTIGFLDIDYPELRIEVYCDDGNWHIAERRVAGELPRLGLMA